jgi:hypothetical protein
MLVHRQRREIEASELYAIVRRRANLGVGQAREGAQIVCRALGDALPDDLRLRVLDGVTGSVAELFRVRESVSPPLHDQLGAQHLAGGRPGSQHPLSEAHARGAQSHSVVMEENPHAGTKLSSARGMTQEREQESIALAHPDDRHSISKAS